MTGRSSTVPLGVVADDVTGACDLAGRVAEAGLTTVVHLGGAPDDADAGVDCAVVALKVRTVDPDAAADAAGAAASGLLRLGVRRIYQKYCSTFDSTARGNIGPIADALARAVSGADGPVPTIGTPATPAAGRTQVDGRLLVEGVPLADTPMRDHPLTPMGDSDLVRLLRPQTPRPVRLVPAAVVRRGPAAVAAAVAAAVGSGAGHVLVDAADEHDLDVLAAAVGDVDAVVAGAAGLAVALARRTGDGRPRTAVPAVPVGGRLVLAGSVSARTRAQVAAFDGPVVRIDPLRLAGDGEAAAVAVAERALADADGAPVLVAATTGPAEVRAAQDALGVAGSALLVERALAAVAVHAVAACGVRHVVLAGGETSGAVTAALGVRRLAIGRSAAPGVPWAVAADGRDPLALLLKSGNFGPVDLFRTAWRTAP